MPYNPCSKLQTVNICLHFKFKVCKRAKRVIPALFSQWSSTTPGKAFFCSWQLLVRWTLPYFGCTWFFVLLACCLIAEIRLYICSRVWNYWWYDQINIKRYRWSASHLRLQRSKFIIMSQWRNKEWSTKRSKRKARLGIPTRTSEVF